MGYVYIRLEVNEEDPRVKRMNPGQVWQIAGEVVKRGIEQTDRGDIFIGNADVSGIPIREVIASDVAVNRALGIAIVITVLLLVWFVVSGMI
jgi:hypothetical protein